MHKKQISTEQKSRSKSNLKEALKRINSLSITASSKEQRCDSPTSMPNVTVALPPTEAQASFALPKKPLQRPVMSQLLLFSSAGKGKPPRPSTSRQTSTMTPKLALRLYSKFLSKYEQKEILSYPEVYFLGMGAQKPVPDAKLENYGFDCNGVYKAVKNDHVAYRYEVQLMLGEGTFSQVFSAFDHREKDFKALKIIRSLPKYYQYSLKEIEILRSIARGYGAQSKSIQLIESFTFRHHRVLVFQQLSKSLFAFVRSPEFRLVPFPQVIGLSYQLLTAIAQFHAKGIIHCDLKPENVMLTTPDHDTLKVIDFGGACYNKQTAFKYIQTRYYRAPEIILGYPYNAAIDMWSFGCLFVEMITGAPLFAGENEQQQLLRMIEFLGYPPLPLLQRSTRRNEFFQHSHQVVLRANASGCVREPGTRRLRDLIRVDSPELFELIEGCLEWDPAKRITAHSALNHPLFRAPGALKLNSVSGLRRSDTRKRAEF